jgi:hypothetical protein
MGPDLAIYEVGKCVMGVQRQDDVVGNDHREGVVVGGVLVDA